uniref:Rab-GAP TBC domain-containing protein n=2 Tax=Wuchereria bancrofti TaxID=6293 RepID=A0A1I8EPU5_WUCBA
MQRHATCNAVRQHSQQYVSMRKKQTHGRRVLTVRKMCDGITKFEMQNGTISITSRQLDPVTAATMEQNTVHVKYASNYCYYKYHNITYLVIIRYMIDTHKIKYCLISYLGCAKIENASNEVEILKIMQLLNKERSEKPIDVILFIPDSSSGIVRMCDATTKFEMVSLPVHRIKFCVRGQLDSAERECFALCFTQKNATDGALHQCHVFRCQVPETAGKVLLNFANAFRNSSTKKVPSPRLCCKSQPSSAHEETSSLEGAFGPDGEEDFQFDAFLEMREEDAKKGLTVCPQEKNCFKLRRDREKRVIVVLQQTHGRRVLTVRKCFGLLLGAGRNLRHNDMHLLDMQSMGRGNDSKTYIIEALWDPHLQNLEVLNTETPRETRVFMTIAADVILAGIDEPVRFNMECKARIFHEHERFWYVSRRPIVEKYFLTAGIVEEGMRSVNEANMKVVKFESVTERKRSLSRISLDRSPTKMPTQLIHPADEDESDSDEPLLSGSGVVDQECSDDVLSAWNKILLEWKTDPEGTVPEGLGDLIRNGVPDVLRGEVWRYLAKVQTDPDLTQAYRLLLGKECPSEQVILRDIHRTFPAHEYFKEAGGEGQESLYRISKAYSLYDEEVSYCQGLSFLAAALLLHVMPEEQAFCTLVKIMFDYGLRDLFKLSLDDYVPDLFAHFYNLGVETHMYASQWFLTLFTAKFPLQMVYFIVDLFLSEGMNTIFHISLALLKASKKELLQLDFEGALKYFRIVLPRLYRAEANAKELIHKAVKLKISPRRLSKYEKEFYSLKERELESQDPLERMKRENLQLKETVMRLERENDDLAYELVTSKIELRKNLDNAEDSVESLQGQLERYMRTAKDLEDENNGLRTEYDQVKEMCRREVLRLELEGSRSQDIISNYKEICSDLSYRLEKQQDSFKVQRTRIAGVISNCEQCSIALTEFTDRLSSMEDGCDFKMIELMDKLEESEQRIRQLELSLAQAKLELVEAQCRNQDLSHQINASVSGDNDSSRHAAWLKKTISSIRDVGTSLKQPTHERSNISVSVDKY